MIFFTGIGAFKKTLGLLFGRHGFKRFLLVMCSVGLLGQLVLAGIISVCLAGLHLSQASFSFLLGGITLLPMLSFEVVFVMGIMTLTLRALGGEQRSWSEVIRRSWSAIKQLIVVDIIAYLPMVILTFIMSNYDAYGIEQIFLWFAMMVYGCFWHIARFYLLMVLAYRPQPLLVGLRDSLSCFKQSFFAVLGAMVYPLGFIVLMGGGLLAGCKAGLLPYHPLMFFYYILSFFSFIIVVNISLCLLYIEYRQGKKIEAPE